MSKRISDPIRRKHKLDTPALYYYADQTIINGYTDAARKDVTLWYPRRCRRTVFVFVAFEIRYLRLIDSIPLLVYTYYFRGPLPNVSSCFGFKGQHIR